MYYALTIKYNRNDKELTQAFYDLEVEQIINKGNFLLHRTTYEKDKKKRLHVHCVLEHPSKTIRYKPFFKKGYMIYFRRVYDSNWESYIEKDLQYHDLFPTPKNPGQEDS